MSDPKIISPLLDGFTLGSPISEHHGVICYPAIKENTNKKYIVKMITVPATQAQFDALLLAGAYKDPGDAMEYFRETGENILDEAKTLQKLSKIEGFLPYDGFQMEPITRRRLGYEVYLVGSYKRSLDKFMRKNAFTHLQAINLSLDLCSALSICRQSGYLYVDLKPSNIFVSEMKEYRIGDLGFLSLDTLRYASLPERYFSPYTPPELLDPMTPINLTVDTYAVGMILYQLYNDGQLPRMDPSSQEDLASPCHADYEMAEIIMKAIHQDPEQRWTDPKDLGKAIAAYMQRNRVNDVPITPFFQVDAADDEQNVDSAQARTQETINCENECLIKNEIISSEQIPSETVIMESEEIAVENQQPCEISEENDRNEQPEEVEAIEDSLASENAEEPADKSVVSLDISLSEESPVQDFKDDESTSLDSISEEVAKIIHKADDIIAHEIPEEITMLTAENNPDPFAFAKEDTEELEDSLPDDPLTDDEVTPSEIIKKKNRKHFADTSRKKKFRKFISRFLGILLLCAAAAGGYWYYQNIFLQTIDALSLNGTQDQITVLVDTGVEESKLTIRCIDSNGKGRSESLIGGKAVFSDLHPSTQYTIQVEMSGFHKLKGHTSDVFTTDATTQILDFQVIAGAENGSVKLDFTVEGNDPDFWNIRYVAEGEDERLETVTDHSAMISGLTIGKNYTFTLDGGKDFDVGGKTSVQYMASRLILAENLAITSADGTDITVYWTTPGDVVVESWDVRCYDGYYFEEVKTVTENSAIFTGLDSESHYTVEVTAAGMTQPSTIFISPDPIHVTDFQVEENAKNGMKITWKYNGTGPEGGWLLSYTVDGSGIASIPCSKTSAVISDMIPGANYKFVLSAADDRTIFNNILLHQSGTADPFTEHNFDINNVSINLLRTPDESDWSFETVNSDVFTNTFGIGDSVSIVFQSSSQIYVPSNKTKVQYIFRDSYGNVLPDYITESSCTWKSIWSKEDVKTGELDIPKLPNATGEYLMDLYFNGCYVTQLNITITE